MIGIGKGQGLGNTHRGESS